MAKIILVYLQKTKKANEWILLSEITNEHNLPYHKARRFILKLVRHGYAKTRAPSLKYTKRKPFDFQLTKTGKCKLKMELENLKKEILSL